MDGSPPGSSVYRILQARILEWVAIPFFRGSSWRRDWTRVSSIAGTFFTIWATREACLCLKIVINVSLFHLFFFLSLQLKRRGKDFFEFLCQLILKEADQNEQFSQEAPSSCLESSLAEIFPLGKNCASTFNSDSGTPGLAASVLVVSHGAYIRSLLDYFLTDLKCSFPATLSRSELTSVSPNTGMTVFILNFEKGGKGRPTAQCVCVNLQGHLAGVNKTP